MATTAAQEWAKMGMKKPGEEGYRPDIDANFNGDFMEYASPERSGIDTGFYDSERGLPWHVALSRRLGTRELMNDAGRLLTSGEALVESGGNFEVVLKDLAVADSGILIPGKFATVRADTGQPLGTVGRGYKVFQNRELAEFTDILVDSGEAKYESGGLMRGGAWFFLSMELDHLGITVPGDPSDLRTYLLLTTSHDGSKKAGWHISHVRTICKNTEELAKKGAVSWYTMRHSGNLAGKVIEARAALGIAFKETEVVKEMVNALAMAKVVDAQVAEILKATWPVKAKDGEEVVEKQTRHFDRTLELYEASPNLDGIRGTAWGAYNAVTEYLDHGLTYHGRKRQSDDDARADSLLFGSSRSAKERALKAALVLTK